MRLQPRGSSPHWEPKQPRGGVAQLGERLFCTQRVAGSKPVTSTTTNKIMLSLLHILGPLWRLCTDSTYKSLPGGAAGLQNRRTRFDPAAACHSGRWSSGKASDCKSEDRGFDPRTALYSVVSPTRFPRIGEHCLAGT